MIGYSVSVDYITATAPLKSEQDYQLQQVYDHWAFTAEADGHEETAARKLGYVGSQMGTAFLGSRSDSRMLTASGPTAHWLFNRMRLQPFDGKITRIDLQCTWLYENDDEGLASFLCGQVQAYQAEQGMPNPPAITLIQGFGKGDTLIVGSRSSEKYIRVYDKSREQHEQGPPWQWRWEAELKGKSAMSTYQYLLNEGGGSKAILYALTAYLDNRGILHPWKEVSEFLEPTAERSKSTYEKSLGWLRSHVRTTVRKLIQAGYKAEVNDALGMSANEE